MLVSIASLSPILVVAPMADIFGREAVILVVGIFVGLWGVASVVKRGSLRPDEVEALAGRYSASGVPVDPVTAATSPADLAGGVPLTSPDRLGLDGSEARR